MKTTICLSCALSLTFLSLLTTCQGQRFTATPSESYYITRGRPATLECEIENVDNIQFACSKELPESRLLVNGRVRNDGVEVLQATFKVIREDIQGYSSKSPFWCECVGETDSGNLIRSRRSEIKPAFLKREFKSHPRSKSAPIGSKVEFSCGPPSGQPQAQISWQKDGRRLNTEKDKNLLINDRGMLVIRQLRQKDLGRYTCMARNIASKRVSNPATLTIGDASVDDRLEASDAPLEDGPIYEKEPDTLYYVTSEKSVDITCRVVGANILTVRCNNRRLVEDEQKAREIPTPQGKIFETTWTVTADEIRRYGTDGSYSCYCVSWYTQPGAQGWLSKESAKGYIELAFMDQDFIAHPRSQTVRVDSSVTLTCTAPRSKPPAEIKWYFNNNELDMNAGIYVIDETSGSLTLESVTMRDAGDYKCSASNRAGTQFSKTARLTVQNGAVRPTDTGSSIPTATTRPPTTRAPTTPARQPGEAHFSTPLEKVYYLTDDEPAVITCGVKSADMITFRCNGRRYERDEINEIRKDYDRRIGKFNIESAIEVTASELTQAGGEYKCICTMWVTVGGNWERKESGPARVEKAFIEDEFAMEPVDTEVQIGFPAELICSPPFGGPEPQVSWMRNRERIDPSKDSNIEITMSGSLSILSMRKKYEGRYTCMASNVAGVRSTEPARLKAIERKESVTDAITESILVDEASTAEPIDYTPFRETEPSSEPETDGTRGAPMFIEEPKNTYYIVRGQFITITCTAKNVLNIAFRCSGMTVPNYRYENNQVTSRNTVSISLELSREDVEGFTDDNSCVCDAIYRPHGSDEEKKLSSSPGYVNLAYIKKRFRKNPEDVTTTEGMMAALPCTPPEALPRPEVYWLFNGQRIDSLLGTNIVQPDDNSLVFVNPTADLAGDYTCVAENVAGKRTSNTARVTVEVPKGAVARKFKKCQEQMSICNRYFTERVRPAEEQQDMEAKCQAANEYSTCVDDFVDKCKNEIKANAIDTILYTRERITSSCRDEGNVVHANLGPYESCNELQMCTRHLTEGDGIFEDVRSACNSLTSMLMCGDSALSKCDIKNTANGDTSLSAIGEWYSKYCNKVVMERTSFVTCESLRPCNTPFNASTSVKDMYDVNMWCPYTYSVLSCTRNALDNCQPEEREGIEADLRMLQSEAADICPREGQKEEVIDVGETVGDDDNGATAVISTSSILISCVHVVFLLVLSLR